MTRIDIEDPITASALELLGQVLEQARSAGLEALDRAAALERGPHPPRHRRHRAGRGRSPRHGGAGDQGAGARRALRATSAGDAVARVVASVGVPVLFLGGPRTEGGRDARPRRGARRHGGRGSRHGDGPDDLPGPRPGRDGGPRRGVGARPMMILTIDFGTSVTKVGLWGDDGLVALARSELTTTHPQVGWAEQDPLRWWTTLGDRLRRGAGPGAHAVRRGRRRGLLGGAPDLRPHDGEGRADRQGHPVVRPPGRGRGARAGRAHGRRRHQPGPHRDPARRRRRRGQAGLAGRARARSGWRRPT